MGISYQGFQQSGKIRYTPEGGLAIQVINDTGEVSVKGKVVDTSTAVDNAVTLCGAAAVDPSGIIYNAGAAIGDPMWIVVDGIADVLFDDNTGSTRGDWLETAGAGYCDCAANPAAAPQHFNEVGHVCETVAATGAGTYVLVKCILHFN